MPATKPGPEPIRELAIVVGGGLACIVATVVGLWWSSRERSPAFTVGAPMPDSPYVGSKVCGECHATESKKHGRSGHARTLGLASESNLARRLDGRIVPDPERPGVTWAYALREGVFRAVRSEKDRGDVERFVLDFVLGSGDHAATFVTITDPEGPASREHRLTYFADADSLGITPGQRAESPVRGTTPHGRDLSPEETRKCFGCHSTPASLAPATVPGRAPIAEAKFLSPNVSCERCHGPARSHVEDARSGRPDLSMPFANDGWTAEAMMGLCGQCHRHPSRFPAERIRPDDVQLARFQPIGLMQSRCYANSQGALSCVSCHDPHDMASTDISTYEATCLSCHGGSKPAKENRPCPVSPSRGCVDCHMPKVDSGQRVRFTDHWIRIRGHDEPTVLSRDRPAR